MTDGQILVHGCELEYLKAEGPARQKVVRVELLQDTSTGKDLLHVISEEKHGEKVILENVGTETIGAVVIVKLEQRTLIGKKLQRNCLLSFWRQNQSAQWRQLIIIDKEKPSPFNCVTQLKDMLSKICLKAAFPMCDPTKSETTHELQFSRGHVAIVPSDGSHTCEHSNLTDFCQMIKSDCLFNLASEEITLVKDNGNESRRFADNCIQFKTKNNQNLTYKVCERRYAKEIRDKFASLRVVNAFMYTGPSPSVESMQSDESEEEDVYVDDTTRCGKPPPLDDVPFWIQDKKKRTSSIYGNFPEYEEKLRSHEHRRIEICKREGHNRFKDFVNRVSIKPAMLKAAQTLLKSNNRLYDIPRVTTKVEPEIPANEFPQDNVESTFASVLRNIVKRTFRDEEVHCPLGLTRQEREKFCWRLDLIEYDIVKGPCWKDFATMVMQLDNDDLEMIEEFSCKYKCQVVEVVLDHWYKLYDMKSAKCIKAACKTTIIQVLVQMKRDSLLKELRWDNEQY